MTLHVTHFHVNEFVSVRPRKFIKQKQNANFRSFSSQCVAHYQRDARKPAILDGPKCQPKSLVPSISICSEMPYHLFYAKKNSDTANTTKTCG
jgi:hypothetical protein